MVLQHLYQCVRNTCKMLKSDRFVPNFVWNLSLFWLFLKSVKIKILFVSTWLLTKMQFYILPGMGEDTKTERVFISPHFCLENLPSKFLPCKLTFWGEEVKMLASPNGLFGFLPTFYPQKSSILTEVMGKDKKTLTIFSSLTKILWSFFHKTASQVLFRCFLPLTRTLP